MILWLFVLGYCFQHVACIFQIINIHKKRNIEGISLDTILFFLIGAVCRLIWMWDSMLASFYFTYFELLVGILSLAYLLFLYYQHHETNYLKVNMPPYLSFPVLIGAIALLSFFFHPGNKNAYYLSLQMFVSLNIFSECIGLLPQLYVIKNTKETGNISNNYVLFMGIARFLRLIFWLKMYLDGKSFFALIIADLAHTVLLFVFIYTFKANYSTFIIPKFSDEMTTPRKKIF